MSLLGRLNPFGSQGEDRDPTAPAPVDVDADLADALHETAAATGQVLSIVPYRHDGGITKNKAFFRNVHAPKRRGAKRRENHGETFTFEIAYWRDRRTISFRYATEDVSTIRSLYRGAQACYHDADIELKPEPLLDIREGDTLSATRLRLRAEDGRDYLQPVNHYDLNPDDFAIHPYDGVTSAMAGDDYGHDASVLVQIVMKPAISTADAPNEDLNWHHGAGDLAKELASPETQSIRWAGLAEEAAAAISDEMSEDDVQRTKEEYQSQEDTTAADIVGDQRGKLGYHVNIRILALSEEPDVAVERVADAAERYRNFYNSKHGQGFRPDYRADTRRLAELAAGREWVDREMPMPIDVLKGLSGPPSNLHTSEVEYTYQRNDDGVPPNIPQFDAYDETGIVDELNEFQNTQNAGDPDSDGGDGGGR